MSVSLKLLTTSQTVATDESAPAHSRAAGRPEAEKRSLGTTYEYCVQTVVETPKERRYRHLEQAQKLLPADDRIQVCMCLKPGAAGAAAMVNRTTGAAYYKHIMTCGDVWACPVCSARISSKRRNELAAALVAVRENDWTPVLVTLTTSHNVSTELKDHLERQKRAVRAFKSGRWFQDVKAEYEWRGDVRALETTYNLNGWHPHSHLVAIFGRKLSSVEIAGLERLIKAQWASVAQRFGLFASFAHGADVKAADEDIAEYVAKFGKQPERHWGAADEVTRGNLKRGRRDGFTPWELLEMSTWKADDLRWFDEAKLIGSPSRAAALFAEYVAAFRGSNQLVWSRGLRELLGMENEQSDAEIAEQEPVAEEAFFLEASAYRRVRRAGKLAFLLELALAEKWDELRYTLSRLGITHVNLRDLGG